MKPEASGPQIHLYTFSHAEDVCPVEQPGPASALALRDNLSQARGELGPLSGAFIPSRHQGGLLAEGDPADVVGYLESQVLSDPPHAVLAHPVQPGDPWVNAMLADPSLLEGDSDEAKANRDRLFSMADQFHPEAGYGKSVADEAPSLALIELETYLAQRAEEKSLASASR